MIETIRFSAAQEERMAVRRELRVVQERGGVLLETCDRLEWYGGSGACPAAVLVHLCRVAAGLESPLLGEKAILGQVRQAYMTASAAGGLDGSVHKLFQRAIAIARKVRSETGLDRGAMSHGQCVQQILQAAGRPVAGEKVLLLGMNELSAGIVLWLQKSGNGGIILANRTLDKARAFAAKHGVEARSLQELGHLVHEAPVLISCTAAPHLIVRKSDIGDLKPWGKLGRLWFDLAAPPDIERDFQGWVDIKLYGLTEIEAVAAENCRLRAAEVSLAESIINREVSRLIDRGQLLAGGNND